MRPFNVMALFCEDIREEKNNNFTLVGVIPDNVELIAPEGMSIGGVTEGELPRILSKLCAYVRVNFDPDFDIGVPELRLVMPDGMVQPVGNIGADVVKKSQADAKANNNILAGVISRITLSGFRVLKMGPMKLEVVINGEAHVAGALMFKLKGEETPISSSASPLPSSQ
jgi:hypothetical protein